jgi:hypothetical protein
MSAATLPGNIRRPALLKAIYTELFHGGKSSAALASKAPTKIVGPNATVFRAFDHAYFTVDTHRQILRRDQADNALIVRDEDSDQNRYTGKSHDASIPAWGGLYCSLQQQATVNEVAHYVEKSRAQKATAAGNAVPAPLPRSAVLNSKCVIKINLLGPFIAVDLSPHNSYARDFVESVGRAESVKRALAFSGKATKSLWDAMYDPDDYSVGRGIGLGLAAYGYRSLVVQTARQSERSCLERGDNIVFFGHQKQRINNLSVVEAYLFPIAGGGFDDPNFIPGGAHSRQVITYPVGF